jgi:hypothetical protein
MNPLVAAGESHCHGYVRALHENERMEDDEPTAMKAGSTLRFRVEDRERGIESATWGLVGSKKTGDLYFSGREITSDLKTSLHVFGITRMRGRNPLRARA